MKISAAGVFQTLILSVAILGMGLIAVIMGLSTWILQNPEVAQTANPSWLMRLSLRFMNSPFELLLYAWGLGMTCCAGLSIFNPKISEKQTIIYLLAAALPLALLVIFRFA